MPRRYQHPCPASHLAWLSAPSLESPGQLLGCAGPAALPLLSFPCCLKPRIFRRERVSSLGAVTPMQCRMFPKALEQMRGRPRRGGVDPACTDRWLPRQEQGTAGLVGHGATAGDGGPTWGAAPSLSFLGARGVLTPWGAWSSVAWAGLGCDATVFHQNAHASLGIRNRTTPFGRACFVSTPLLGGSPLRRD